MQESDKSQKTVASMVIDARAGSKLNETKANIAAKTDAKTKGGNHSEKAKQPTKVDKKEVVVDESQRQHNKKENDNGGSSSPEVDEATLMQQRREAMFMKQKGGNKPKETKAKVEKPKGKQARQWDLWWVR